MKWYLMIGMGILFLGCNNQPQLKTTKPTKEEKIISSFVKDFNISKPVKKIAKELDKPINTKEVKKTLLKTSPYYAKFHQKEALQEHIRVNPVIPLYKEPLFAEMYVMPYVSNNGIYHDTQKIFIKIKDGEWVLNTDNKKYKKGYFSLNQGLVK